MEVVASNEGVVGPRWCKQVDVGEGLAIHTHTPMDLVFATGVCLCVCDFCTLLLAVSSRQRSLLIVKKWNKNFDRGRKSGKGLSVFTWCS